MAHLLFGCLFENSPRRSSQRFFRGAARFHFSSRDTGREEAGTTRGTPQNKPQFTEKYGGSINGIQWGYPYTHTHICICIYIYISYIIDLIGMDKGYPHGLETSIYDMMRF